MVNKHKTNVMGAFPHLGQPSLIELCQLTRLALLTLTHTLNTSQQQFMNLHYMNMSTQVEGL